MTAAIRAALILLIESGKDIVWALSVRSSILNMDGWLEYLMQICIPITAGVQPNIVSIPLDTCGYCPWIAEKSQSRSISLKWVDEMWIYLIQIKCIYPILGFVQPNSVQIPSSVDLELLPLNYCIVSVNVFKVGHGCNLIIFGKNMYLHTGFQYAFGRNNDHPLVWSYQFYEFPIYYMTMIVQFLTTWSCKVFRLPIISTRL